MMTDDQIDELIQEAAWRAQWEASLNEVQAQHISNIMGDLVDSILTGKDIVFFAYQEEEVNDAIRH